MVLHIVSTFVSRIIPSTYYLPIVLTVLLVAITNAYAQGRRTNRDRDLHARTIILTGAFTPLGLTLLEFLAKRGAHIIALAPTSSITTHHAKILSLLRESTANESIYIEPCPLNSPAQISKFCHRFVNAKHDSERRVDALIFAHEYSHIGTWMTDSKATAPVQEDENVERDEASMATFLLITLLLPALLVAPVERDIRIINIINPFYAAAAPAFNPALSSLKYNRASKAESDSAVGAAPTRTFSKWSLEGQRALRSAVFMRHLQRILDALPEMDPTMSSSTSASNQHSGAPPKLKSQLSNILAVTVSPGISRTGTVAPYLFSVPVSFKLSATRQWATTFFYIILQPFLRIFTKTSTSAIQSVLHVLCVPKPITRRSAPQVEEPAQSPAQSQPRRGPNTHKKREEEVLVPGALYADCAVKQLTVREIPGALTQAQKEGDTGREESDTREFELGLGKEPLGRAVWEALEGGVKIWEAKEKEKDT